jgi:hypothetical protein
MKISEQKLAGKACPIEKVLVTNPQLCLAFPRRDYVTYLVLACFIGKFLSDFGE